MTSMPHWAIASLLINSSHLQIILHRFPVLKQTTAYLTAKASLNCKETLQSEFDLLNYGSEKHSLTTFKVTTYKEMPINIWKWYLIC